jgi:hypothetical protein
MPEGPEWQLELNLDGYRGMGIKSNGPRPAARYTRPAKKQGLAYAFANPC